jgi:hypothetical protein
LGLAACCLLVAAGTSPVDASAAKHVSSSGASNSGAPRDTAPTATLIGAGDICVTSRIADARATAKLIAREPDAHMFTLGDNSNETGTAAKYADCYRATWGQFLDRTSASVGNHDYGNEDSRPDGAVSYFAYFGKAALARRRIGG